MYVVDTVLATCNFFGKNQTKISITFERLHYAWNIQSVNALLEYFTIK